MPIYSLFDLQFWLFLLLFCIAVYISIYIPGRVVLSYFKKQSTLITVAIAIVFGIVLWGIQGYLFGYLNFRILTYLYLLFFLFLAYKKQLLHPNISLQNIHRVIKENKIITSLLVIGGIVQSIPLFGSGLLYPDGVRFIGVNAYDGMMHLSYIQSIVQNFPPIEPGSFPNKITNYHYWTDLILADITRIWSIPVSHLFFQYVPIAISLLTGIVALALVQKLGGSKKMAIWFLFLLYFSGDAAYLFMLLLHQTFGFYTPAIDNGPTQFLNMPHAIAKPIFLVGIMQFIDFTQTKKLKTGIAMALVFGVLFGFKVYFGIYIALGLLLYGVFALFHSFLKHKKKSIAKRINETIREQKTLFLSLSVFALVTLAIYLPPNSNAGGLFFAPLEWPKLFLNPDNINFQDWWLRRQVYEVNGNIRNMLLLDALAIGITLVAVYGTRLLGFLPSKNIFRFFGHEKMMLLLPGLLLFQVLGFFTLQESGGFNVFNFFATSAVILSLFSSFYLSQLSFSKNLLVKVLIIGFILLTIPRAIFEISENFNQTRLKDSTSRIPIKELDAFQAIRKNTPNNAIIQSHPANPLDNRSQYVAFFSGRNTYLTGVSMQETHNQPISEREKIVDELFNQMSEDDFVNKLEKLGIRYVYLQKKDEQVLPFSISDRFFDVIHENDLVYVIGLKDKGK